MGGSSSERMGSRGEKMGPVVVVLVVVMAARRR
jgi:hypothetical protein